MIVVDDSRLDEAVKIIEALRGQATSAMARSSSPLWRRPTP